MPPAHALIGTAALLFAAASASAQPNAVSPPKLALLVGCTSYPDHPRLRQLYGPANDVKIWREALTQGFKFPDTSIVTLAEWPDDETKRPTCSNIHKAFKALIDKAAPGAQVVIVVSGHGMQMPLSPKANPLDPKNFEPDGLDEVFLPADVERADENGQIKNAIKDDQFGEWLDALRAKGAHVMIVFDSCHSGTMTRTAGAPAADLREISRVVHPEAVGITPALVAASVARAEKAVQDEEKRTGKKVVEPAVVKPLDGGKGGTLVAFYAAQSFEEAPELPLPEGAPLARENYYGLLSFTVLQAMKQRATPLTYRELSLAVGGRYRAERGVKGPTPFVEGDLDREVLGYNVWPNRSEVVLEKDKKGGLSVNAGTLSGITEGSILAVHPPAGTAGAAKAVLGYVRVQTATVASAIVVPEEYEKKPAPKVADLPNLAPCSVAARDYGDMRVKLFLGNSPVVKAAFADIAKIGAEGKEVHAMINPVASEAEAEWLLRAVASKEAKAEFGLDVTADSILLVRGAGRTYTPVELERGEATTAMKAGQRRVFGVYPLSDPKNAKAARDVAGLLARDLPKLFRWQNLWRVAVGTAGAREGDSHGLKLEIVRQPNEKATGPGEVVRGGVIANNTVLDFQIRNDGKQKLWVVAMYLDAELEITVYEVVAVDANTPPDKPIRLTRGVIEKKDGEFGTEGMVLFALPLTAHPAKPNFKFLEQSPLKEGKKAMPAVKRSGRTPFEDLLDMSVVEAGTRAPRPVMNTTPGVIFGSWVVVP